MPTCDYTVGCHCVCQCDCPGASGGNGNTFTPEPAPTTGGTAKPLHDEETSAGPVRYFNGEVQLACDDFAAAGFGSEWGHTRIYSNRLSRDYDFGNGYNWLVRQWPYLVEEQQGNTIVVMRGTRSTLWFDLVNGNYVARFGAKHVLTHSGPAFTLAAPNGAVTTFNDFSTSAPGSFSSQATSGGQVTKVTQYQGAQIVEIQRSATVSGTTTTESFYYTYAGGDIQTALLRRQVGGGAWSNVAQATYGYYGGGNGSLGDLQSVSTQLWNNGAWQTTGNSYYRYWTSNAGGGLLHGLKYVVNPASYDRMTAAGITPATASDAQLAQYADYYFEYDSNRHVTKEVVQGGTITYTFSLTQNTNPGYVDAYNNWKMKTVETLPDLSTNTVYTNYVGEVMLKQLSGTGGPWTTYTQFNGNADPTLYANPSAIGGFNDAQNNLGVTLNASSGLVHLYDYYEPTSVGGYLQNEKVQNGASGTIVSLRSHAYTSQAAGGVTIYPISSETAYRNDDGTGAVTTNYSYTYYTGALAVSQRTTTLPAAAGTQNGSGISDTRVEQFDQWGNTTQLTDERGTVTKFSVDVVTGALAQRTDDALGMALVTDYQFDAQGRTTQALGPSHTAIVGDSPQTVRTATWTVYDDANHQVRTAQGYATGASPNYSYTLVNPVSITITDADGRSTDQIAATRASTSGALSPTDTFAQSSYVRWTHNIYNAAAQLTATQVYYSIPASGSGALGTNYNETDLGYDADGRQNKVASPVGTITRTVHDPRGLVLSVYIGTNDAGATDNDPTGGGTNNMLPVTLNQYDGGLAGGDGNLTQQTLPVDSNSANNRVWTFQYDWRDRPTRVNAPQDFYSVNTFDTMDRVTQVDQYSSAFALLIGRSQTLFDDRGRVYQTVVYGVDPTNGTVGNALTSNTWYDAAGNAIKQLPAGSSAFTKMVYDALGRQTKQYLGYDLNSGESSYSSASSVADDTIMEQVETAYDEAGNVIQATTRQRFHNATGGGDLTSPGGTQPVARVTYLAYYVDAISRQLATADYGTNGDVTFTRSASIPLRSDTVLVTSVDYASDGTVSDSYDPALMKTLFYFDQAGRKTKVVENVRAIPSSSSSSGGLPGCDDANHTTLWTYTADDQVATVTAVNAETGDQTTSYGYGASLTNSDIARNDLLASITYPDASTDKLSYFYNRQSQVKEFSDGNGTVHAYSFDLLGRLTQDAATALGGGIDGAVRRIATTYEVRGMLAHVTSYDNATVGAGNVVNDVLRTYNTFRQVSTEYQEHSGAVNTSSSVSANYDYVGGTGNTVRATALVYPSGRNLNLSYGDASGMDDALSRVSSLIDNDGFTHLADYTRLGLASIVQIGSPQPGITWSLINGTGNDPYTGLDRFNRVADSRWYKTSAGTDLDRIDHGYDRLGNRLYRVNRVAENAGVYLDEQYIYDGIYRLQELQRGAVSDGAIAPGTLNFAQAWGLDATGNWGQFWQNDDGSSWDLQQSRTANKVNEITGITGGNWVQPVHDGAGNTVTMPQPGSPTATYNAVYDAWNRLVSIQTVETNAYDGLNRRVTKTAAGATRHYYYSVDWRVIEERVGTSTTADEQFVWGLRYIDDLVLRDAGSPRYYALQDPNWNVSAICDVTGAVQERYTYTAYGQPTFRSASFGVMTGSSYAWETLFAGYRWDSETGLYQVRHRFLHALLGGWLTRDPEPIADGANLYQYSAGMPIKLVDPYGLQATATSWVQVDNTPMNKSVRVKYGTFNVKVSEKTNAGFRGFDATITFTPSDANYGALRKGQVRCGACSEIQMIQIVRNRQDVGGKLTKPYSFTPEERKARGDIQVPVKGGSGGWSIDRDYGTATSIFWNETGNLVADTGKVGATGDPSGAKTRPAVLKDVPGFQLSDPSKSYRWEFITCAYCNDGAIKGQWLGCVSWQLQISVGSKAYVWKTFTPWALTPEGLNAPPADFKAAVKLHQKTYPNNSLP